jgi:hypothetical protein
MIIYEIQNSFGFKWNIRDEDSNRLYLFRMQYELRLYIFLIVTK